ncbi:MAG TPA: hypothetical protein VFL91_26760 [Thermomicrobiales bacterium]|nr:hypothetical protein [Thermomicrobiales bacterium]
MKTARRPRVAPDVRAARTCYDHLAGVAGVALCERLLALGWLAPAGEHTEPGRPALILTDAGRRALAERGIAIPPASRGRRFAYACPDWTEPGAHLGGALGAAILRGLEAEGLVRRREGTRAVQAAPDLARWPE